MAILSPGTPLFTVGVTTFNRREMLRECLRSISLQTFPNYEVIIGNDCLEDQISLDQLGTFDSRFRIINHKENLGEASNMNWLLNQGCGEYFLWMADDDSMHPEFLSRISHALSRRDSNPPAAVYTDFDRGDEHLKFAVSDDAFLSGNDYSLIEFLDAYLSRRIKLIGCYGAM